MVRGKLTESIKIESLALAERYGSETVYWNGAAITTSSGVLLDTQDYDNCSIVANVGTILGEAVTLLNAVYESETDDPTALAAISGADFTQRNSANDEAVEEGHLLVKNTKRYIGLRTEIQGTVPTIDFSAVAVLGIPDSQAPAKTLAFDL